jgi:hypothetical protein
LSKILSAAAWPARGTSSSCVCSGTKM